MEVGMMVGPPPPPGDDMPSFPDFHDNDSKGSSPELEIQLNRDDIVVHEKIGSGSEATVYSGTWRGKKVAIKQIRTDKRGLSNKQQIAIAREVSIITTVRHKNLVSFFGTCFASRPLLLVCELCEGGTLFELLHNCMHIDLTWEQRATITADVARAMTYLHGLDPQILHRDLKSLNLLLAKPVTSNSDKPIVKVADFGLARTRDKTETDFKMTSGVGSIYWMAPEVNMGRAYDEKVDVYSFAMVLFEILCRDIPFNDLEPREVEEEIMKGSRPALDMVPNDCPKWLIDLMVDCWANDPSKRPSFKYIVAKLDAEAFGGEASI